MDMTNILTRLERRQLGYGGFKKNIYDNYIEKLNWEYDGYDMEYHDVNIGNTFACKFSKNRNNLHIMACVTEHGEVVVQNTKKHCDFPYEEYHINTIHDNAIFNFSWAEPSMKLVTASGDQSSKLCNLLPSGILQEEREFNYNSSVKSVMFCPGSSDIFCGGCQDGSIKIWDARVNNSNSVIEFDRNIPNAHCVFGSVKNKKTRKVTGMSCVIFKNNENVISCSSMDPFIKIWDLRKSYCQVRGKVEPVPLLKYTYDYSSKVVHSGFVDMVVNPQTTHLYASGINNVIYCYSLDTMDREPMCQYSGHLHETVYSKICISHDGRYLFSGCMTHGGVIWLLNLPYIEQPVLCTKYSMLNFKRELSCSDWCADSNSLKLAVSADAMPIILKIKQNLPSTNKNNTDCIQHNITRTTSYASKFPKKIRTTSMPLDVELTEQFKKETEKNMENWDHFNERLMTNAGNLEETPKQVWQKIFSKVISPSSQESKESDNKFIPTSPVSSDQKTIVTTPTSSRKRKKSILSPRNLIDHYLVSNNKREKLDTVVEM